MRKRLVNHLEHIWWKSNTFMKNLMVGALFITFFVSCPVASAFGFWLQGHLASYIFN